MKTLEGLEITINSQRVEVEGKQVLANGSLRNGFFVQQVIGSKAYDISIETYKEIKNILEENKANKVDSLSGLSRNEIHNLMSGSGKMDFQN